MEEFKAQLGKMDKEIKGLGPFRMVEETINGFQQSLPLIQNLKSDSLRERHWLKLMELTGKTFDMNPRTFTLGSLFELRAVEPPVAVPTSSTKLTLTGDFEAARLHGVVDLLHDKTRRLKARSATPPHHHFCRGARHSPSLMTSDREDMCTF